MLVGFAYLPENLAALIIWGHPITQQIEVRCWDSVDARVVTPTPLSYEILEELASEIIREVPGIVSVTYNIAPKPPSTIEAV